MIVFWIYWVKHDILLKYQYIKVVTPLSICGELISESPGVPNFRDA